MLIFAGLGNPGAQYQNNRHNVGFMAADAIARRHGFSPWARKFQAHISEGNIAGEKILLMKPLTFMNLSGQSVGEAMRFYKLGLDALTVFYDELDLVPGKVRVKRGGGSGGHNGIKSLDAHCGVDYERVRIGIGHPGDKARVHNYVLGDFSKADHAWLEPLLDAIADHVELLAKNDAAGFLNKLAANSKTPEAEPKKQSHIRQARPAKPKIELPTKGPMAEMLARLLSKKN